MSDISITDLCKQYDGAPRRALDRVGLRLRPGAVHAVVGPNGSGKTTLFRFLAGLVAADSGCVNGRPAGAAREVGRAMGGVSLLSDAGGFHPALGVLENLRYLGAPSGGRPLAREAALGLLARLNLSDKARAPARSLSRGMQQRLRIAIALAVGSRVLLLDEPTNGLDIEECLNLFGLLRDIAAGEGRLVAFSSHDPSAIAALSDEATLLVDGRASPFWRRDGSDGAAFVEQYLHRVSELRAKECTTSIN